MAPLTTVVVDNNCFFVRFFAQVLADHYADLLKVRAVCRTNDVVACCTALEPQIILLDLGLPGMTNLRLLAALRRVAPGAIVVVLSSEDDWPYVEAAQRAGATALLSKDTLNDTLRATITELCSTAANDQGRWICAQS
jgi:DNA-binding NarL/FixJ family response regulator